MDTASLIVGGFLGAFASSTAILIALIGLSRRMRNSHQAQARATREDVR